MACPKPINEMGVSEFERMFRSENACGEYLVARRWPNGIRCPRCGATHPLKLSKRSWLWRCHRCARDKGYEFSHLTRTVFENGHPSLCDWFTVVHLMTSSDKRITALQIHRMTGFGTYKTVQGMCRNIRAALVRPEEKLGSIIEVQGLYADLGWWP